MRDYFGYEQLGVAMASGIEYAYHSINEMVVAQPQFDIVALDATNAFNAVSRKHITEEVSKHFPEISTLLNVFYKDPSRLVYGVGKEFYTLASCEGMQQGDPLGPFAFSMAVHPLYQSAKDILNGNGILRGYLDDCNLCADVNYLPQAVQHIVQEGNKIGYRINPIKSRVLISRSVSNDERDRRKLLYANAFGLSLVEAEASGLFVPELEGQSGIQLLGTPLGSQEYVRSWLEQKILSLQDEFQEVASFPDLQGRWLLISHVLRAKVTHLYRSLSLQDSLFIGEVHDGLMLQVVSSIIGMRLDDGAIEQLRLPISEGGFGVPYLMECVVAARVAAQITFCRYLQEDSTCCRLLGTSPAEFLQSGLDTVNRLSGLNKSADCVLLKEANEVLTSPVQGSGLQKVIYGQLVEANIAQFAGADLEAIEIKRRQSVSQKESGAFLFAFPNGSTYMQPTVFKTACQYRLGLPITALGDTNGLQCICSRKKSIDSHGYHFSACRVGEELHSRHDAIVCTLQTLMVQAGIKTKREPRGCFSHSTDKQLRPDIRLFNPGALSGIRNNQMDIVVDVRITDPLCSSNISSDSITRAEQQKCRTYQQHSYISNLYLMPIVMESFGRFSEQTTALVKALVKRVFMRNPDQLPECRLLHYWYKRI